MITKGPWFSYNAGDENDTYVCVVKEDTIICEDCTEDDARAISAVPELIGACETVYHRILGTNVNTPLMDMYDTWNLLRDALKKAKGE